MNVALPALQFASRWLAILYFRTSLEPEALPEGAMLVTEAEEAMPVSVARREGALLVLSAVLNPAWADGRMRQVTLRDAAGEALSGPATVRFPVPDHGKESYGTLDSVRDTPGGLVLEGWAVNWLRPADRVPLFLLLDDRLIATMPARGPRPDLARLGFSDGNHGFRFTLQGPVSELGGTLSVRLGNGREVNKSPHSLPPPSAILRQMAQAEFTGGAASIRFDRVLPAAYAFADEAARLARHALDQARGGPAGGSEEALGDLARALERLERAIPRFPRAEGPDVVGEAPSAEAIRAASGTEGFEIATLALPPGAEGGAILRRAVAESPADILLLHAPGLTIGSREAGALVRLVASNALVWGAAAGLEGPDAGGPVADGAVRPRPAVALVPGVVAVARVAIAEALAAQAPAPEDDPWPAIARQADQSGGLLLLAEGLRAAGPFQPGLSAPQPVRRQDWRLGLVALLVLPGSQTDAFALRETVRRRALAYALAGLRPELACAGVPEEVMTAWREAGLPVRVLDRDGLLAPLASFLRTPDGCHAILDGEEEIGGLDAIRTEGIPVLRERLSGPPRAGEVATAALPWPLLDALDAPGTAQLLRAGLLPQRGWRRTEAEGPGCLTFVGSAQADTSPVIREPERRHPRLMAGARLVVTVEGAIPGALHAIERGFAVLSATPELVGALKGIGLGQDLLAPAQAADQGAMGALFRRQRDAVSRHCDPERCAELLVGQLGA
jgi:hypothetical protein